MGARYDIGISDPTKSSYQKGGNSAEMADTYVGYITHFIVTRDGREGAPKWMKISSLRSYSKRIREYACRNGTIPRNLVLPLIFNGGDGSHNHPTQVLLDSATMQYLFGRHTGLNVGIINDLGASRVFASQADVAGALDWNLHLYALEGAEMRDRERRRLNDTHAKFVEHRSFEEFAEHIRDLDVLYVHRYQKNLRDGASGDVHCTPITLDLLNKYGFRPNARVLHARPVDSEVGELGNSLRWHTWNASDTQSDFGVPARMAMMEYAIQNNMFQLDRIAEVLRPEDFGFTVVDLSGTPPAEKKSEKYTTAYVKDGIVVDHIPPGCSSAMEEVMRSKLHDVTMICASGVKGDLDSSVPKDVIKIYGDIEWPDEFTGLVALFTDTTVRKSCRVSEFRGGKRVKKWTLREESDGDGKCENKKCITQPEYNEGIRFSLTERADGLKECPFCNTVQQ
jgi:aspartate carbamoyltransferase catalytic subunit/aspartate carbamoyltransferase regulatory subunit